MKKNSLVRKGLIILIKIYHSAFGGLLGKNCKFYPTCSNYALDALKSEKPIWYVVYKIHFRILSCNPFSKGGVNLFN